MSLSDNAIVTLVQAKDFLRMDAAASLSISAEYVGVGDGSDKTFSLDHTPVEGSLKLYVNGVLQVETTDFTISGADITFVTAPTLNHGITAAYNYAASANTFEAYDDALLETLVEAATKVAEDLTGRVFVQRSITESHNGEGSDTLNLYKMPIVSITSVSYRKTVSKTGDGSTVAFSLGYTPKSSSLAVYVEGVLKTVDTDYTLDGIIVTFSSAPTDGDKIIFKLEVELDLVTNYSEGIHIGRLYGSWLGGYEYIVVYTAGHGADRDAVQGLIPDAVTAVLLIVADLYENRGDRVDNVNISGLGSASYKLPSRAAELLNPLRTNLC